MERKNKGLIAMVVILTILVLGLGGYIVYNKVLNKSNDTVEHKETKNSSTEKYDNEKAKKLLKKFGILDTCYLGTPLDFGYDDNYKNYMVLNNLESKAKKDTCKSLLRDDIKSNSVKYNKMEGAYETSYGYCKDESIFIDYEDANQLYKEMFGNLVNMPTDGNDFLSSAYYYSFTKDGFIKTYLNRGGASPTIYISELKDAIIQDDILTVEVYHVMLEPKDNNENVVFTFGNKTWDANETDRETIEKEVLQEKEKMDIYKVIFIKEDEHYIFGGITKKRRI